ncbi:MAG: hypothetical protein KY448_16175, partial [Cyanobacteria bacterium 0813]|nr:hypothetical protein [Cyanobacteria bacterium 0813]
MSSQEFKRLERPYQGGWNIKLGIPQSLFSREATTMSLSNSSLNLFKSKRKLSLRSLLIVPFVLQIFAAVGLTGYISLRNGQQAINDLATRLRSELSLRIDQHLGTQLDTARNLAQTNADAIELGLLDPKDPAELGQFFWKQLKLHDIGYISFAYTTGDFAGAGHFFEDGRVTVDEVSRQRNGNLDWYIYNTNSQGQRTTLAINNGPYIPKEEGWYREPARA